MIAEALANALKVWLDGGPVMVPLFLTGVLIYAIAAQLLLYFWRRGYQSMPQEIWEGWIRQPEKGVGEVGEIIRYTQDEVKSLQEIRTRFEEIYSAKIPRINRRLAFLHMLVLAAPLMGLLGTVLGMIKTFEAISAGAAHIADMVARGISEALITTETGLLVALPGYFLSYVILGKRNEYVAFLARLESATMQHFQKSLN